MSDAYIRVHDLYKVFGPDPASVMPLVREGRSKDAILAETGHAVGLRSIDLSVGKGQIFVIMGLSGSGKSTLIRHFNRLIEPTEGRIVVDGEDVMTLSKGALEQFRRHRMSMVFQHFGLMPHRTVLENVAYGLTVQSVPRAERRERAHKWLRAVGLDGYENQYPAQLSGGQQQRIGLARALCTDAEILLMDEAFSALDPLIRSEMQDQLIELQAALHKTIIFITHDLDEALRLGDRIAILKDGELVQVGPPEDILLRPATPYVEAFVRDVNRARALTVDTVMLPPACRITAKRIGDALEQMRAQTGDYGYYIDAGDYRGVIARDVLERAARDGSAERVGDKHLEDVPSIPPDALLETVLPSTLDSDYDLPVVDEGGALTGQLSRGCLAEVLGDRSEPDEIGPSDADTGRPDGGPAVGNRQGM